MGSDTQQRFVLLGCLMLPLGAQGEPLQELVFEGRAYALGAQPGDTEALLYTEQHRQTGTCLDGRWTPATGDVTYFHPDGRKRGSKELNFSVDTQRPSFTLLDDAFNERIEVTNQGDKTAKVVYAEDEEPLERSEVSLGPDTVIDSGFDQLVGDRWDALMAGDTIRFEFLAPTRGKLFSFEGVKVDDSRPTVGSTVIRIQPDGFFINLFADPIFLAYNDDRRLTDYMGLGNMRREGGGNLEVHIRYQYKSQPDCAS